SPPWQRPAVTGESGREFRDASTGVRRHVGDARFADNRGQLMFAMGMERDVFQQDKLVIAAHFFQGACKMDCGVFIISLAIFFPCSGHALWCVEKTFPVWILTGPAQ